MVRRLVTLVLLVMAPALIGISAWADTTAPYPAPPVDTSSIHVLPTSSAIQVLPTSSAMSSSGGLAYTGVSFDVGLAVGIAAAVLVAGIVLLVLGARGVLGRRAH